MSDFILYYFIIYNIYIIYRFINSLNIMSDQINFIHQSLVHTIDYLMAVHTLSRATWHCFAGNVKQSSDTKDVKWQ